MTTTGRKFAEAIAQLEKYSRTQTVFDHVFEAGMDTINSPFLDTIRAFEKVNDA